jgi:hypothetical protein
LFGSYSAPKCQVSIHCVPTGFPAAYNNPFTSGYFDKHWGQTIDRSNGISIHLYDEKSYFSTNQSYYCGYFRVPVICLSEAIQMNIEFDLHFGPSHTITPLTRSGQYFLISNPISNPVERYNVANRVNYRRAIDAGLQVSFENADVLDHLDHGGPR